MGSGKNIYIGWETCYLLTDSVPNTLSISIFLFNVVKNRRDCSEINLCGGFIVKRIELVFFIRHHFFKPMSANILCISVMTLWNI